MIVLAVFFAYFGLYLWSSPPGLSAYRDAGEMALSAYTLGVSHPPSYPFYILAGHAATLPPLGTPAYRVAVLSALAGAGALALLFWAARRRLGAWPAAACVLLLGSNSTFWGVCQVQEMYSLTLLMAAALLALALETEREPSARRCCAGAFLFGLFLGNRTDLVLWAPGLLLCILPLLRAGGLGFARRSAGFFLLGLSVYLYLPLRSLQGPWLDWNHPATLWNFIGSLTRRGYGGTLDLLSKSYAPGENFLPNLQVYGRHLWDNFYLLGLAAAAVGCVAALRGPGRRRGWALLLLYAASGPMFLYMANMPPNPHSLAIVEPHYLLSDLVVAWWAAEGVAALSPVSAWIGPVVAVLLAAQPWPLGRWRHMDRRESLVLHDYAGNAMRSAKPGAVLVAKKDVQLFSLWYYQRVEKRRPDLRIVAQGLAHTPWHQAALRRENARLAMGPLREDRDWLRFAAENGETYASMDADISSEVSGSRQRGLLIPVNSPGPSEPEARALEETMVRRGELRYERRPEFFTADLVDAYAAAYNRWGKLRLDAGDAVEAKRRLWSAWAVKSRAPETLALLGYLYFRAGDALLGASFYELAVAAYEETLERAAEFRALADTRKSIVHGAAEACLNLGAIWEKSLQPEKAERMYRRAMELEPNNPKSHYNMAVLYWGKDWPRVVAELEAALRIDPGYQEALRFLPAARSKL